MHWCFCKLGYVNGVGGNTLMLVAYLHTIKSRINYIVKLSQGTVLPGIGSKSGTRIQHKGLILTYYGATGNMHLGFIYCQRNRVIGLTSILIYGHHRIFSGCLYVNGIGCAAIAPGIRCKMTSGRKYGMTTKTE